VLTYKSNGRHGYIGVRVKVEYAHNEHAFDILKRSALLKNQANRASGELMNMVRTCSKVLRQRGVRKFVGWLGRRVIQRVFAHYWASRIRAYKPADLEELLRFSYGVGLGIIRPTQLRDELLPLLSLVRDLRPTRLLEIGTEKGGTLFLFSRVASHDATIISVDLPGGPFGGGYSQWRESLYKSFFLPGQKGHLVRKDSHDPRTLRLVKSILQGEQLDFLFIDGDHTYDGVKRDFEMYAPLVRKGGLIGFHDIVPNPREPAIEVSRFWEEIRAEFRHYEIVENWGRGYGIGLIEWD